MSSKHRYEAHVEGMLEKVWSREGHHLTFNPVDHDTPLAIAIRGEMESSTRVDVEDLPADLEAVKGMDWEELAALVVRLMEERDEIRENAQSTMLNYFFAEGPHPLRVAERVFIFVRGLSPTHCWMMRQVECGDLFCLIKQTWQQKEKRCLEELAARMSTTGVFTMPGGKSATARDHYSEDKKGNTSKKRGRRRGDTVPPDELPEEMKPKISDDETEEARARWERHQREMLARELGCDPADIDLTKITPEGD